MFISKSLRNSLQLAFKNQACFGYYSNMQLKTTETTFYHKDLTIQKIKDSEKNIVPVKETLKFGHTHTDYLLQIDYTEEGWKAPKISKFENFSIHPFNTSLHYAIECFEGMKAFKDANGKLRIFRGNCNMHRLRNSAAALTLPDFDGEELLKCIESLIALDERFVYPDRGYSLYIRPTYMSMDDVLGVRPPVNAKLFVVLSPVGPYYPSGFKPISIAAEQDFKRSFPGGTGDLKIGGNYAPTLRVQKALTPKGHDQILWLIDGQIQEVGTSNLFFYWKNEKGVEEVITPPLDDGTILPGVTRDSVIELCKQNKINVVERNVHISEVVKAVEDGRMIECFGSGTAVIVCPVKNLNYNGKDYTMPINPEIGSGNLTKKILDWVMDIQYGVVESDWCKPIN